VRHWRYCRCRQRHYCWRCCRTRPQRYGTTGDVICSATAGTYHWRVAGAASSSCVSSGRLSQYPTIDDCVQPLAMSLSARNGANATAAAFPIPLSGTKSPSRYCWCQTQCRAAHYLCIVWSQDRLWEPFSCTVDQPPHPPERLVSADHKVGLPSSFITTILNVDIAATKDEVAGVTIRRDALSFRLLALSFRLHQAYLIVGISSVFSHLCRSYHWCRHCVFSMLPSFPATLSAVFQAPDGLDGLRRPVP
jgi:hypothetical protein